MKRLVYQAIAILALSGCSQIQTNEKASEEKAIFVKVSEAKSERIVANLRYSGTIEPSQTIPLTFQTSGTVEKVLVEVGDPVRKGQLLASIDKTNAQNMYDIANAKYTQAKDAYRRLKSVHEQGSLPEIKWVEMETNLEQAKSSLELSKSNLDKCNMYAPVNGFIGRRNIEPGMSSISIAAAPLELVDIKTVYIKIAVPENEIGLIKNGLKASCKVSALNNKVFDGAITNVSPIADAISRTYNAKIQVKNSDLELKPGMVCDVTLNIPSEREMILIPYQSVTVDKEGKPYVFVVDNTQHRAKKQHIETGNFHNESLEVLSGLSNGQFIVTEGKEKLSDNSLISL
jgi:membrane fusion protein, multidrug efflux system